MIKHDIINSSFFELQEVRTLQVRPFTPSPSYRVRRAAFFRTLSHQYQLLICNDFYEIAQILLNFRI